MTLHLEIQLYSHVDVSFVTSSVIGLCCHVLLRVTSYVIARDFSSGRGFYYYKNQMLTHLKPHMKYQVNLKLIAQFIGRV